MADVVRSADIGLRLAISEALQGFLLLVGCQGQGPTENHTTSLRTVPAITGPGNN